MKLRIVLLFMTLVMSSPSMAQLKVQGRIDSMLSLLPTMKDDTSKVNLFVNLSKEYARILPDSNIAWAERALVLARRIDWKKGEANAYTQIGIYQYNYKGNYDSAVKSFRTALRLQSEIDDKTGIAMSCSGIGQVYAVQRDYPTALEWYYKSLKVAEEIQDYDAIARANSTIGDIFVYRRDYPNALDRYFRMLKIAEKNNALYSIGSASSSIAYVYFVQSAFDKSLEWELKAASIADQLEDEKRKSYYYKKVGTVYLFKKDNNKAREWLLRSMKIIERIGDSSLNAVYIYNVYGTILLEMHAYDSSNFYYRRALQMAKSKGWQGIVSNSLHNLGENFKARAEDTLLNLTPAARASMLDSAIQYVCEASLIYFKLGQPEFPLLKVEMDVNKLKGDHALALENYKEWIIYNDSTFNIENDKKLLSLPAAYESQKAQDSIQLEGEKRALGLQQKAQLEALHRDFERKQTAAKSEKERQQLQFEEALKNQEASAQNQNKVASRESEYSRQLAATTAADERRRLLAQARLRDQQSSLNTSLASAALVLLVGLISYRAYHLRSVANLVITREREKSESLLRNILPADVAVELKEQGHVIARQFEDTSVLFTDFVDFTTTSQNLSPQVMVKELHECFSAFDEIIRRNGLEKIKTIGDTYMAVCGLPQSDPRHAQRSVQAGLEILHFMNARAKRERVFGIRVGINSGPVLAGIVGVRKFAYDIWGDTVNTAARMEQNGRDGAINISQSTYELVKADYNCTYRGEIAAKNKGEIAMYFVEGPAGNGHTT